MNAPRAYRAAVATPGSRMFYALASLGMDAQRAELEAYTEQRSRALQWVAGIVTKSGRDRAVAISSCGRPQACMYGGEACIGAQRCRDRACPRCARLRSKELAAELRQVADKHRERGRVLWFVTLTQPKPETDDPVVSLASSRDAWRRLTNKKTAIGRKFHSLFSGALRATELTWSPAGAKRKDGSRVPYSGWHAHFHCVVEGGNRAALRWLLSTWAELVDGSTWAQDAQLADDARIGQLCKYIVKPLECCPIHLARRLFEALHGKRMLQGVGSWKGWRDEVVRELEPPLLWSDTPLPDLLDMYSCKATRDDGVVTFAGYVGQELVVVDANVPDVVLSLRRWLTDARRDFAARSAAAKARARAGPPGCGPPPPSSLDSASTPATSP